MANQSRLFPLLIVSFFMGLMVIYHFTEDLKAPEKQFVQALRDSLATHTKGALADTLFINLWKSNCGPCKREMPHLADWANDVKNQGSGQVQFLAVTNQDSTKTKKVRNDNEAFFQAFKPIHQAIAAKNTIHTLRGKKVFPANLVIIGDSCVYKGGYMMEKEQSRVREKWLMP